MDNISFAASYANYKGNKRGDCSNNVTDCSCSFAVIRLTVDFFEENKDRIGDENFSSLIHTLRKVIEADCNAGERIIREFDEGLDVLVFYRQQSEMDQRISKWCSLFNQSAGNQHLPHDISFSAGVYEIGDSFDKNSIKQYLTKANFAKLFGHICSSPFTRYYSDKDYQALRRQKYLETQIPDALHRRQLLVYMQPMYSLSTRRIVGAEALARWKHPKLGMLMPDEFIPLFEQDRLIIQLDFYVLEETCWFLHQWRISGLPVLPVSVNFSKQHAATDDFVQRFLEITERYHIRPEELCVEWTENVFAEPDLPVGKIAGQLQSRGFRIAMDDFGSGYSSLNMLTDLPVDIIKLDKQFLIFEREDRRRRFLLQQMIRIAQELRYTVLAEGVEYDWQAELLHNLGYEYVQGFFYSPPISIPAYEQMICAQTEKEFRTAGLPASYLQLSGNETGSRSKRS